MSVKKNTNVVATLYEGVFDITYECVGTMVCQFSLCSEMPATGNEECCFRDHGSCRRTIAKQTALEKLINRLKRELKQCEEEQ